MKTTFYVLLMCCGMLFSCQKKTKYVNNQIANIVNIFPLGPNNFWKAYYHAPYGGPGVYERGVDSFYVSTDTVGLYTISNNNNIIDTNWVVYNIIKVKRTRKNFNDLQIYTGTEKNYGIVRVDTATLRVYTAVPACLCWTTPAQVPNYSFFNERLLFDYNLQTNDTAYIKAVWTFYNTTLSVDSFVHNGNIIKRQVFYDVQNPGDTVTTRTQFGCIFNTNTFVSEIVTDFLLTPNAYTDSVFFFYNMNDSVKITRDTDIYP